MMEAVLAVPGREACRLTDGSLANTRILELYRYEAHFRIDPGLTYRDLYPMPSTSTPGLDDPKVRDFGIELIRNSLER